MTPSNPNPRNKKNWIRIFTVAPDRFGGDADDVEQRGELRSRILNEFKGLRLDIRDLEDKIDKLKDNDISDMKVQIAMLKVKAGVWGLIGASIPITLQLLIRFLPK